MANLENLNWNSEDSNGLEATHIQVDNSIMQAEKVCVNENGAIHSTGEVAQLEQQVKTDNPCRLIRI